jgi:two-component system response regulator YesN
MYKLLIVDDEPKIRSGLRMGYPWEELGFRVVGEASNGSEALDFIAVHPIDVVLTDIRMPVISGIGLVKRLNEMKSEVKVVLLSGYREFEYAQKAIQYGVFGYLVKPTGYNEVLSTFSRLRETLKKEGRGGSENYNDEQQVGGLYDQIINAVYEYIDNNIADASLEGAAQAVGRSIYYLSRLFKQHTGQNFSDYVMAKKMERAAFLLSSYHYKIFEISNMLGYDSAKNFSKAFKAYYGKSPRDFRETPRNGEVIPDET